MLGVEFRGNPVGEVSILSEALASLRGGDDALSAEFSDTDGKVIGLERGVLGVLGRITILATRRMDCRTFHWRFLATKKRTVVAAVDC
jgi:hypothetical protein